MKAFTRKLAVALALLPVSGCATYQSSEWAQVVGANGKIYVLRGMERDKTESALTVDGTFKKFTVPVLREFDLYDKDHPEAVLQRYTQNGDDCRNSIYDYFPEYQTLIASCDSWYPSIANINKHTSFRVKGLLLNSRQSHCKFALTRDSQTKRMYIYDKMTGAFRVLTKEALDFVGDTWHTELSVIEEGTVLAKVSYDYGGKEFTIATWDLAKNIADEKSCAVSFGKYREPSVVFISRIDHHLTFLFGSMTDTERLQGYSLTQGTLTGNSVIQRLVYASQQPAIGGFVHVVPNNDRSATIIQRLFDGYRARNDRWTATMIELSTGDIVKSETFTILGPQ
jgi:hypothetical protein